MKIDIPDAVVSDVLYDFVDALILAWMKRQLDDDYQYSHPDDIKFYKKHKKCAKHFINYLSVPDERD